MPPSHLPPPSAPEASPGARGTTHTHTLTPPGPRGTRQHKPNRDCVGDCPHFLAPRGTTSTHADSRDRAGRLSQRPHPNAPPTNRDYVKKIAVYKDKLAVQLSSKIVIYELANPDDPFDMHYQARAVKWGGNRDVSPSASSQKCGLLPRWAQHARSN